MMQTDLVLIPKDDEQSVTQTEKMKDQFTDLGLLSQIVIEQDDMPRPENTGLVISIGGDGTLLRAHRWTDESIPILPAHTGNRGFMTELKPWQAVELVKKYINWIEEDDHGDNPKPYIEENVPLLSIETLSPEATGHYSARAMVDFYIKPLNQAKTTILDLLINDFDLGKVQGDGIIVATPLGSTAYNMSVGGPILYRGDPTVSVSAIAPYNVFTPIVLCAPARIEATVVRGPATMYCDGDEVGGYAEEGESIIMKTSVDESRTLIRSDEEYWHQKLRERLRI